MQEHLHDHIANSVWDSHKKLERLMNALYHRERSLEFLGWILQIDDGKWFENTVAVQFLEMAEYHIEIEEVVTPPFEIYYFAIHVSLLLFRYKEELGGIQGWNELLDGAVVRLYWENVCTLFADRKNAIKKVYLKQAGGFYDDVVQHRERIYCGNEECNVQYYEHKYGTYDGSDKFTHRSEAKRADWYRCKGCKLVYYCSRRCQKIDWNGGKHKAICSIVTV